VDASSPIAVRPAIVSSDCDAVLARNPDPGFIACPTGGAAQRVNASATEARGNVREVFSKVRALCASMTAAGLVLGAPAAQAANSAGLGGYKGPITTWLARAPAGCVINSYFMPSTTGFHLPKTNHVAYWVGHAMDDDLKQLGDMLRRPAHKAWSGMVNDVNLVSAVDDPQRHVAAYWLGKQDLDEWGAFADAPDPPAAAPPMRADLTKLALGGNVHLGDSLAVVTSALGTPHAYAHGRGPRVHGLRRCRVVRLERGRLRVPAKHVLPRQSGHKRHHHLSQ